MPSRRQVLRTAGAAGGIVFAGQAAAARGLDGERLSVQQAETPVVTVDRQITDGVPDGSRESVRHRYPFTEGSDGTVYVSESDDEPAFSPHDGVVVADSTNNLQSTGAGSRVSLTGRPQSFHSSEGGVIGEMEPTVALDVSERPAAGVRVVGDGVSATVAPGESTTVELTGSFRSMTPNGEAVTDSTTVEVTVEHRGVRQLVTHPTATLTPKDHRLGRLAAQKYAEVGDDNLLSVDRSTFELNYDERGFFAHETIDTQFPSTGDSPRDESRIADGNEPVSAEGIDTKVLVLATEKFGGYPWDVGFEFEDRFNNQMNKEVNVWFNYGLDLGSPDDFWDAWEAVKQSDRIDYEINTYDFDGVMVVDDRSLAGPLGVAYVGTAGSNWGFGYSEHDNADTVTHEFGHLYGASHGGSTTHWRLKYGYANTLMGYQGVDPGCYGNNPGFYDLSGFSNCSKDKINSYVANNL
jgi:hypothetical protein